jgi:ribosome maturation factor RimP
MMIKTELIRDLLQDELALRGLFLVEVLVRPANKIVVFLDSMKGVTLDECMAVSRYLERKLDRNLEDFELEVSSPGLDRPLKLPVQFEKNTGRMLDVVKYDGIKVTGKLKGLSGGVVMLETEVTAKDPRTGKRKKDYKLQEIKQEEIKTAIVNISIKSK